MTDKTSHSGHSGYSELLRDGGFQAFLWTQFLGAFNDNVFKMIVSVAAVALASSPDHASRSLSLASAVFVLPFLLFAGWAGQLADRYSKSRVLVLTKACEIPTMLLAAVALQAGRLDLMLGALFLLAAQANFFSPAKYGVLPEMLPANQIMRANALLELSTFVAIVVGGAVGTTLFEHWKHEPLKMGMLLVALAVLGSLTSLRITRVPACGSPEPFHANPFAEILTGARHILGRREMTLVVLGISFFWFVGGLVQMDLILYGKQTLAVGETKVGLLVAAMAIGIGLGSLVAGRWSGDQIELGLVPIGTALMGVATIGLGFTANFYAAAAILAVVGFAGGLFIVPLNAWLQEEAGTREKGRVLATNNFVNMIGVILASGSLWALSDQLGWTPGQIFVALGCFTLAATALVIHFMPLASLRFFLATMLHSLFRLRIVGAEKLPRTGGALVVANHVSYADGFLIAAATPRYIRFLLWKPIYENRWLKPFFQMLQLIPIAAGSKREAMESLIRARKELEAGELVGIFPEGQITRTSHLLPFRSGYERIVTGKDGKLVAPIVPVYIDGLWGHPMSMKGGALFQSFEKLWRPTITVYIGDPITEPIEPAALHAHVSELGTQAARLRPAEGDTLPQRFAATAKARWSAPAVADSTGKQLKYGETLIASRLLAQWLDREAAGQEHIGLLLPTSVGGALANLAVAFAGRTAVNLNFTAGDDSMSQAIQICGIRTILTSKAFAEKAKLTPREGMVFLEDVLPSFDSTAKALELLKCRLMPAGWLVKREQRPGSVAAIIFSSGSTGEPKGVALSHWNLISNCDAVAQVYTFTSRDSMLGVLPFFHSFGYTYNLWFPLLSGARAAYHPNPMDAKIIGELAEQHGSTFLLSTPTFCAGYTRKCTKEQFSKLRYALVGAEKLRESLAVAFTEKFGVPIYEGYGCTEMAPVVAVNGPDFDDGVNKQQGQRAGSVGRPIPSVSVRIVDPETMQPREHGEEGLLLVDGPSRMLGYHAQAERTAKVMHQGFYVTGDIARMDADGFLYITDRLARFSKIGGEMVPHLKVEEALYAVLGDSPVMVLGVPDESRGERLVVLYTRTDVEPAAMVAHLGEAGLPALWIPKRDQFLRVEAIPTLGTGKTDLRKCREMALAMLGTAKV